MNFRQLFARDEMQPPNIGLQRTAPCGLAAEAGAFAREGEVMRHIQSVGMAVISLLVCLFGFARAEDLHIVTKVPGNSKPLSPAALTRRIEDAATEYRAYAPIPRVGFYDVAYPATKDEATALNGFAILLVTTFSQDSSELPFRRVYVTRKGNAIDLKLLGSVSSTAEEDDGPVAKTFGRYRSDALYLLPIYLGNGHGILIGDFSKNRDGFKLGELEGPPQGDVKKWSAPPVEGRNLADESLRSIIRREYPGFLSE